MDSSFVATVIGHPTISGDIIHSFENTIRTEGATILRPQVLSENHAIDFFLEVDSLTVGELKQSLNELADNLQVDVILQSLSAERRDKGLFVFDMDSTLIQQEVIDLIAAHANVQAEVSRITEEAMNGKIDFKESFNQRVSLLKGLPADVFEQIKPQITFTPGAKSLCKFLREHGVKMAVLSGGFLPLAVWVKNELGLDYAFANELELSENGKTLTGRPLGQIVDGSRKAELLQQIAHEEKVALSRVVAVGDGSNDLAMMSVAGFGIAWNAKPIVQKKAPSRLNTDSLQDVLYILGYSESDL